VASGGGQGDIPRLPGELGASASAVRRRVEYQRDKMANLGELTTGIAHEINNSVGYIASNLGSLRRYTESLMKLVERSGQHLDPAKKELWKQQLAEARWDFIVRDLGALLDETRQGADHLKQLVADLKTLARASPVLEPASIDACAASALTVLNHQLRHRCAVQRRFAAPRTLAMVKPQIMQLVINLVHNAAQAMGERGGTLRITTADQGGVIILAIEDSGPGVPEGQRDQVFIPYYTTKANGTGLGLAIVAQIARAHGGDVVCDASPELGGARFTVTLRGASSSRAETQVDI
jgi:two-component system NtrC family sensor kinase